jgi:CubicO group peptidase (beta-lactamase class C family)
LKIDVARLDTFLEQKRQSFRLPGLSVAVVGNGENIYLRGLGNAALSRCMTSQTPLIIGSLSKSFTALAIMQLVEAGKLSLDDPIQHYLSWFHLADAAASSVLTLRHLLTHTSGISRYEGRELLAGRGGKTIEQSVRELSTLKLTKPVGMAYQYSNTNYLIAGLVVEVASGQSFETYLQQHIFAPLGMQHSHASEQSAMQDGLASGYRWWFGLPYLFQAPYLADAVPAAFIASSAEDMARYALAMLGGGSLDGISVLSSAGMAEMHHPQATINTQASYGLGWRMELLGGLTIIRHGGEVSNFISEIVLIPSQQLAVVTLLNVNNGLVPQVVPQEIKLASSIVCHLLGLPPQLGRFSLRGWYLGLNTTLILLSLSQCWSMLTLLRSSGRSSKKVLLASLTELGALIALLRALPRLTDAPWRLLRLYVPDVTSWLSAFCMCSFAKCFIVLARFFRGRKVEDV